ncbi:MAG: O-antigen ligase family protein [Candidatus Omnitrophica bacterium]|nr:O-antigen ligase family protein [Candidatus Omnitrophota bacterium]
MIGFVKNLAPVVLYVGGIFLILRALTGKTEWLLWFVIALLPLRNIIEKLHMYPLGKDLVDIFILILLVGTVVKNFTDKQTISNKSPINTIVVIFIGYTFLSLLQGSFHLNSFKLFDLMDPRVQAWKNLCALPALYFITLSNIRTKKHVWITVVVMCVSMVLMNYYLTQQIAWYSSIVSRKKIHGTFSYLGPNEVAAFYAQYTVLLLSLCFMMKRGKMKMMLYGLMFWNSFIVMFLFSRASYGAFAIGLFFLFAIKKRVLLIPLILVVFFWQVALPDKVQDRITETANEYGELDRSSEARLVLWQHALDLFSESPVIGVGYRTFRYSSFKHMDTHNTYLRTLAEQGLVGIFIFLFLLFIFFVQGVKLFSGGEDGESRGLGLGFMMCVIVLMVNNFFGDRWSYIEVSSNLWVFAALVSRLIIIDIDPKDNKAVAGRRR